MYLTSLSFGNVVSLEAVYNKHPPWSCSADCQRQPHPGKDTICCPGGLMHIFSYNFGGARIGSLYLDFLICTDLSRDNL